MKMKDLFAMTRSNTSVETFQSSGIDAFADSIALDLRAVATAAIKRALEERETRYMKSVLDESYFILESLVVTPRDREIAKTLDAFLSVHEAVDSGFRHKFFQQIVQREYRSSRGSCVRVPETFEATIQLGPDSLESMSSEEGFQVSLKGRRISFAVEASLGGPLKREAVQSPVAKAMANLTGAPAVRSPITNPGTQMGATDTTSAPCIDVSVSDSRGNTQKLVGLPVVIGRNSANSADPIGVQSIGVHATYISRSQIIVFELMGNIYYFIPEGASLTCVRHDGLILERQRLYPLASSEVTTFRCGMDTNGDGAIPSDASHADFPVIHLNVHSAQPDKTPRPRAVA